MFYLIFCNSYVILKNVWFSDEVPETKTLFSLAFIEQTESKFEKIIGLQFKSILDLGSIKIMNILSHLFSPQ